MNLTLNDVAEIVEEIEEEALVDGETLTLAIGGGTNCQGIHIEASIWNSEEDERIFYEDKNEYEPLKDHIVRKLEEHANHVLNTVKRIKLVDSIQQEAETGFKTFMDGNKWCAVQKDFINLQESLAGYGDTEQEARDNLVDMLKEEVL